MRVEVGLERQPAVLQLEPGKERIPVLGEEREVPEDLDGDTGADQPAQDEGEIVRLLGEGPGGTRAKVRLQPPFQSIRERDRLAEEASGEGRAGGHDLVHDAPPNRSIAHSACAGVVTTPRVASTNTATATDARVFIRGRATAGRPAAGP